MYKILESLKRSRSSLLLEVNQFLQYVKDKFSDVILPVESITKQSLLGKGTVCDYNSCCLHGCHTYITVRSHS